MNRRQLLYIAPSSGLCVLLASCGPLPVDKQRTFEPTDAPYINSLDRQMIETPSGESTATASRTASPTATGTPTAPPTTTPTAPPTTNPTAPPTTTPMAPPTVTDITTPNSALTIRTITPDLSPKVSRVALRIAVNPRFSNRSSTPFESITTSAEIKTEIIDTGPAGLEQLKTLAIAGNLPDLLVGISGETMFSLESLANLSPLDKALTTKHDFLDEMLALGKHNNRLLGLPMSAYPTYLLFSRERFTRAGVYTTGSTFLELEEAARQLTDRERYEYGFGVVAGLPELETVARSAGRFPKSGHALQAWQWYIDQWQKIRTSPPPSTWDGCGDPAHALIRGRVATMIVHGRALDRLIQLPEEARADWDIAPMPAWPNLQRRIPLYTTFIAAPGPTPKQAALQLAAEFAGPAQPQTLSYGTPSWIPALASAASSARLDLQHLLEARSAWVRPMTDTATWRTRNTALNAAVHSSLTHGQPASLIGPQLNNAPYNSGTSTVSR